MSSVNTPGSWVWPQKQIRFSIEKISSIFSRSCTSCGRTYSFVRFLGEAWRYITSPSSLRSGRSPRKFHILWLSSRSAAGSLSWLRVHSIACAASGLKSSARNRSASSWLPRRDHFQLAACLSMSRGLGPYPMRSPRQYTSSVPCAETSLRTASSASVLECRSEISAILRAMSGSQCTEADGFLPATALHTESGCQANRESRIENRESGTRRHPAEPEDELDLADLQPGLHADVGRILAGVAQFEDAVVEGIGRALGGAGGGRRRCDRGPGAGVLERQARLLGLGDGFLEAPDLAVEPGDLVPRGGLHLGDEAGEVAADRVAPVRTALGLPAARGGEGDQGDQEGEQGERDGEHGFILPGGHAVCKGRSRDPSRGVGTAPPAAPALLFRNPLTGS